MRYGKSTWGWAIGLVALVFPEIAGAQTASDLVAEAAKLDIAQKKVDEADELVAKGQYIEACRLYDLANELVPELKTELALVECLVKLGQYADAHQRMVTVAKKVPPTDPAAQKWANGRVKEILASAPCITIDVNESERNILDLEIDLDGQSVPRDSWSRVCYAVNLGKHVVKIRASQHGWTPQTLTTLVPEKRYAITINPPASNTPKQPPLKSENPVKPLAFIIPAVIFAVAGIGIYAAMDHHPDDPTREIFTAACFGAGTGALISGVSIYLTATPTPISPEIRTGFSHIGFGLQGRF